VNAAVIAGLGPTPTSATPEEFQRKPLTSDAGRSAGAAAPVHAIEGRARQSV
jgi:hypothetical protein